MDIVFSQNIQKKYNLIPRKISKILIKFLNDSYSLDKLKNKKKLTKFVSIKKVLEIKKEFLIFKKNKKNKLQRNEIVYKFIKKKNNFFDYKILSQNIHLKMPTIKSIKVSLASCLFQNVITKYYDIDYKIFNKINIKNHNQINKDKNLIMGLDNFLTNIDSIYNDEKNLLDIIDLFKKIKSNKKKILNIISPVCPDYSYKKIDRNSYSFTFKKLNSGIGLVAKKIYEKEKFLKSFFEENQIKYKHYVLVGDFEGYNNNNLLKLKLNLKEFLSKVNQSQKLINKKFNMKKNNLSFLSLCGGNLAWEKKNLYFKKKIMQEFENNASFKKKLLEILNSRNKIYSNWYPKADDNFKLHLLISQGAEYVSMGYFIKKKFDSCLILGADHHIMSTFYKYNKNLPVIYIKKNYKT